MIDVVLCASGSDEVRIVHGIAREHGAHARVVRRCADLAETLAVSAAGIGDVVLVDVSVRGLSRETITTLLHGSAVVGLRPDDGLEHTSLGLQHVVSAAAPIDEILAAISRALDHEADPVAEVQADAHDDSGPRGPLCVVWGPAGAPGRSTIAVNLAAEAARAGRPTVLVDADTYGPSLGQMLGIIEETPGIVSAGRAHDRDTLDEDTMNSLLPLVQPGLRLLSGIGVPARWAELRTSSLDGIWHALARRGELVIADVSASLEEDEELSYDTAAPQRNAAAITAVRSADAVIAVVTADPVSITRFLRDHARLAELGAQDIHVIVNRVGAPVPGERIRELLAARVPLRSLHVLPDDPVACRTAAWDGALLAEAAPRSALRRALRDIAASAALWGEERVASEVAR